MSISTKNKHNHLLMFILTLGVFGILNTEMGVVGIIPIIAETFGVTVPDAGWTVSLFALIIAFSAPVVPLLFSRVNRKTVMVLALSVFVISNLVSVFTTNFTVLLITRAIPAFFHPLYVSIAFSTAASSVSREDAPKAVSKIFAGVSAGMVLGVPVTSYIASEFSFSAAMVFFTVVNAFVLLATIFFIPTMPVKERLSYGTQLSVLKKQVAGKRVLLVDDSIVRGTNSIIIARMLRDAGAKEVHMRISSPPVKFPCLFGINTPTSKHLIGAQQSVEDLRKSLGLDSLAYLDLPLLEQAVSDYNQGYCTACFDGNYPMDIHKCKNCVSILKKIKKERQR